jgi:GNAT superfamily N-acetyltransferase
LSPRRLLLEVPPDPGAGPVQQHSLVAFADAEDGADVRAGQSLDVAERDDLTLRGRQFLHELAHAGRQLGAAEWLEYLSMEGLPPDFLADADHAAFHVLVTRSHDEIVAAALAYDFADDCGIYNVETVEKARRRGLGTALTAAQVHDALARGCQTASLQSTQMAERVYAAVGFRDLGRILEYVPPEGER